MRSHRGARSTRVVLVALLVAALTPLPANADRSSPAERRLVELMNAERAAAGLAPLKVADDLQKVAYGWSVELADRFGKGGGTAHNPSYSDQVCCWTALGENVGWASGGGPVAAAETVHRSFMGSSGHRGNVVDARFTQVGVGVEVHSSGTVYVTVDFRRPSGSSPSSEPAPAPKPAPKPAQKPEPTRDPEPAPAPASEPAPEAEDDAEARAAAEAREAEAHRRDARRAELEERLDDLRERHARFQERRATVYEARLDRLTARRAELAAYGARMATALRTAVTVLARVDSVWEAVNGRVLEA